MRRAFRAIFVASFLLPACGVSRVLPRTAAQSHAPVDLLVVAPHPDDEVLMAGGAIAKAVRDGEKVSVVVVTNGDYTWKRNGYEREAETVRALALLGVGEENITFLGYPDGYLGKLGEAPLGLVMRRGEDGGFNLGDTTYANRGAARVDEHMARTGEHARYTSANLTSDLAAVLDRTSPRRVIVSHPNDGHRDHAMTYEFFRRAFDQSHLERVEVLRAFVHVGPCWPNGASMTEPCPAVTPMPDTPMPDLPPAKRELLTSPVRIPIGDVSNRDDRDLKMRAIGEYRSQFDRGPNEDWLMMFARSDELFSREIVEKRP